MKVVHLQTNVVELEKCIGKWKWMAATLVSSQYHFCLHTFVHCWNFKAFYLQTKTLFPTPQTVNVGDECGRRPAKILIPIDQPWTAFCDGSTIRYSTLCIAASRAPWSHIADGSSNPFPKYRRDFATVRRYIGATITRRTRAATAVRIPRIPIEIDRILCGLQEILQWLEEGRLCFSKWCKIRGKSIRFSDL